MMPHILTRVQENRSGLIFCLCLSVAVKILLLALFDKPINTDGVLYISAARHFAAGQFSQGAALYAMPMYPMLITLVHFVVPNWDLAARVISMVFVACSVIPLYLLTRDLFDRRAAFWAALAFALSPMFNEWAIDVIRGPGFVFCVLWAAWFAQQALSRQKPVFFWWTAALSFVSFFFRIEGIFVILFFGLFVSGTILRKRQQARLLAKGLLIWLVSIAILAGAGLAVARIYQMPLNRIDLLSDKAETVVHLNFLDNYLNIYETLEKIEKNPPFSQQSNNLLEITRHFMYWIYLTGLAKMFVKVMFPCFFVALFFANWRPMGTQQTFVLGLAGFFLFMIYLSLMERDFTQQRFLFTPACLLYPWVGQGLNNLFDRLQRSFRPKLWLVVFCLFFIAAPGIKTFRTIEKSDDAMLDAGRFARQSGLLRDARVLTNDDRLPYYAGLHIDEYETTPPQHKYDFSAIAQIALKNRTDVIYIKVPREELELLEFSRYWKIKGFTGKKRNVYIYGSIDFCKNRALQDDKIPPCNPGP